MRAELSNVCHEIEKIIDTPEFILTFGEATMKQSDHFGHGALIICLDDHDLTIANISSEKDGFCTPGVYLNASTGAKFEHLERAESLIINKGGTPVKLGYRLITESWLTESPVTFKEAIMSLVAESKEKREVEKSLSVLSTIALSRAQRKLLHKVGIRTNNDIVNRGYARVYLDVKKIAGQTVKEDFVACLWGSVHGIHPLRVPKKTYEALKEMVAKLALSDFSNYINMNEHVARRVSELGYQTMSEVRAVDFESLATQLVKRYGAQVGHDTALAVFASLQREHGISVEHLSREELIKFDECMADVSDNLMLGQAFSNGMTDGVNAMMGLLANNRFQNNF